jgi:serine/threonine protein kinase
MLPGVTLTEMGPVASVEYTDPGLLQGARAGPASDVWSLAVTLHRVLTGAGVYGEDLPTDDGLLALRRLLSAQLQLADGLTAPARGLIEACTGPEESRPSAAEFADRLGELL